jgi:hypothetical protein
MPPKATRVYQQETSANRDKLGAPHHHLAFVDAHGWHHRTYQGGQSTVEPAPSGLVGVPGAVQTTDLLGNIVVHSVQHPYVRGTLPDSEHTT